MIQINLSEEQARLMLAGFGWREGMGYESKIRLSETVAAEVFRQLERHFEPVGTEQAEFAVWRHEHGYTAGAIEEWKRKNETAESAFANYVDSVSNKVMEKYK